MPQDLWQLRSFLGLANYFWRFLKGHSSVVAPLTSLTGKGVAWEWAEACQKAFNYVKSLLVNAHVLRLPDFDRPFTVVTNAFDCGIGGVLLQESHPPTFESCKLNSAELTYTTTKKELLAIVQLLRTWRCYLEVYEFTVVTDHNHLVFFRTQQQLSRREARWSE